MGVPLVIVAEGRPDGGRLRPSLGLLRPGASGHEGTPVVWVDGGSRLAITTMGSSSAPAVPVALDLHGDRLTVTLAVRNPGGGPVTADLALYVTVFEAPQGLDPHDRAVVRIHGVDHQLPPVGTGSSPHLTLRPRGQDPMSWPDPG